jgi:hypothetical protein
MRMTVPYASDASVAKLPAYGALRTRGAPHGCKRRAMSAQVGINFVAAHGGGYSLALIVLIQTLNDQRGSLAERSSQQWT